MASSSFLGRALPPDARAKVFAEEYFSKPMHAFFRWYDFAACDLVPLEINRPVLDLGCGNGAFASVFCRVMGLAGLDFGLDVHPQRVYQASRRGLYKLVFRSDARALPIKTGTIKFLLCSSALQAIPSRHDLALGEVARVLEPSGQLLMTVPTPGFTDGLLPTRVLTHLRLHTLARLYGSRIERRGGHRIRQYFDAWRCELERVGLAVEYYVHFFSGRQATWWSVLALRPFQAFAILNYLPGFIQRLAISSTARLIRRVPTAASSNEKEAGYLLVLARKI